MQGRASPSQGWELYLHMEESPKIRIPSVSTGAKKITNLGMFRHLQFLVLNLFFYDPVFQNEPLPQNRAGL